MSRAPIKAGDTVDLPEVRSLLSASMKPPAPGRYVVEAMLDGGFFCRLRGLPGLFISRHLKPVTIEVESRGAA